MTASLSEKMRISTPDTYLFAAKTNSVPLASTEFELGCRNYPIVFSSQVPSLPIAILGFGHEENLFVESDGRWMAGTYIPAYVRKFPFIFSENTEEDVFTLCIDSACLAILYTAFRQYAGLGRKQICGRVVFWKKLMP